MSIPENPPPGYPLLWPAGKERTKPHGRRTGTFKRGGAAISRAAALDRIEYEVERLNGRLPVVTSNVAGLSRGAPTDPGVSLWFKLRGKPHLIGCDTYSVLAQNIAAIAAHLEATRAIERHGVGTAEDALAGFAALPSPDAFTIALPAARPWWEVLGMPVEPDRASMTADVLATLFRSAARKAHPDHGGSADASAEVNRARTQGAAWLAGK